MSSVLFEPNLTVGDRDIAAAQITQMWEDAMKRRDKIMARGAGTPDNLPPAPDVDGEKGTDGSKAAEEHMRDHHLADVVTAANVVATKLTRMRQSA